MAVVHHTTLELGTDECVTTRADSALSVRIYRKPTVAAESACGWALSSWTDPAGGTARGVVLEATTDRSRGDGALVGEVPG